MANNSGSLMAVSASLYVGDLDPEVTETMLYEVFNSVAVVSSVRICRDALTRRSLGYAYVNYNNAADAERALDTLNFTPIRGKPCRIMWSIRDPSSRRNNDGNVFVKNLDKTIDNKTLFDTFSLFGNIMSCKIATDSDGNSLGYGFIHFENPESANEAITRLNGMMLGDNSIYVGKFKRKTERYSEKDRIFTNVYVKHIPKGWTEEVLSAVFSQLGKISSLVLQHDSKGRPFGFVNYEDPEAAKNAVIELNNALTTPYGVEINNNKYNNCDLDGEITTSDKKDNNESNSNDELSVDDSDDESGINAGRLYVCRAQKRNERQVILKSQHDTVRDNQQRYQAVNLYVKNLPESITETELMNMFKPFGTISSVSIKTDENNVSKGFGFVSFLSPDEATKAITEMHLKLIKGKPLYVGLHERREQRALRLQQRHRGGAVPPVLRPGAIIPPGPPGTVHPAPMQFGAPPQMYFIPGNPTPNMQHMRNPMMGNAFHQQGVMGNPWRPSPAVRVPYNANSIPQMVGPPLAYSANVNHPQGAPNNNNQPNYQTQGGHQNANQNLRISNQNRINKHTQNQSNKQLINNSYIQTSKQGVKMPGKQNVVNHNDQVVSNDITSLSPDTFSTISPNLQKQILGEKLFPIVLQYQPELAGKITGMMLEMDNSELLEILNSETEIKNKVDEAMLVLERAQQELSQ